jgi:hypothetical protein
LLLKLTELNELLLLILVAVLLEALLEARLLSAILAARAARVSLLGKALDPTPPQPTVGMSIAADVAKFDLVNLLVVLVIGLAVVAVVMMVLGCTLTDMLFDLDLLLTTESSKQIFENKPVFICIILLPTSH